MKSSERLAKVEAKMGYIALAQKEIRDEIRVFRTELFKLLNPMISDTSRQGESIKWLKRFTWLITSAVVGIVIKVVAEK